MVSIIFLALTALMAALTLLGVVRLTRSTRTLIVVAVLLFGWLVFLATLATEAYFLDFDSMPPRMAVAIVPSLLAAFLVGFRLRYLERLPVSWLIAPQAFRIVVEAVLYVLWQARLLPELMTLHGRNWDLLTGVLAIPVALVAARHRRIGIAFNVLGLALLLNVVLHGLFSAPTPFRYFMTEPPNTFIAYFPYVWLPGFLIPLALTLHILSLRQLRAR
ncbi:MAG TPA: hypothetical protein VF618_10955 [Thermoanaerobaculia bacterium]